MHFAGILRLAAQYASATPAQADPDVLILGGGLRYDNYQLPAALWQNPKSQLSPRASLVYRALPQLSFRVNYGHAFRAPTMVELGIEQQMYAATLLGNSQLNAETLDSYEAATDLWVFSDALRLSATGFYSRASNLINEVRGLGTSTAEFQNTGDARAAGFQFEAGAQFPRQRASFDAAYQYLDTLSHPFPGQQGGQLDYAAHHRIYARAHVGLFSSTYLDLYGIFVGSRQDTSRLVAANGTDAGHVQLPSYVTLNARFGVRLTDWLGASLYASNLLNQDYQESYGFPNPGRSLFAELKLNY